MLVEDVEDVVEDVDGGPCLYVKNQSCHDCVVQCRMVGGSGGGEGIGFASLLESKRLVGL